MKLLLDTHIWLWSLLDPAKLSRRVASALQNDANELWLSPISVWEVLMLAERGRIVFDRDAVEWVQEARRAAPLAEAPLTVEVALATRGLALRHRDPADAFLAATAKVFGLTLVTTDRRLLAVPGIRTMPNR